MRKLILVVHTSLDGFVAGPNGELDGFNAGEENLDFVAALTAEADAALLGRISWQLLNSYWPNAENLPNATKGQVAYSKWFNSATKIVISATITDMQSPRTVIISNHIPDEIIKIKKQPGKHILIFGSPAVSQTCMLHDLIDEYWVFINPVIFGKGIPLFAGLNSSSKLTLLTTRPFANGEMALHYRVNRN